MMNAPAGIPLDQQRSSPTPRILVVDDEIYMRGLLVNALVHLGYVNIDTANDGAEAWESLHKATYCLVLTDHKMPRVTGLELIARMRSAGMPQPVILISGTMPTEELRRNPGLRVDALLPKPFTLAELSATIAKLPRTGRGPTLVNEIEFPRTGELAATPARGQMPSPRRILLVDDDRESRELAIELLTGYGYQVEAAEDGAAGWEALRSQDYDLVITDNRMPKMTGLELIEKLNLARMTVPVIMATGNLPTDEFARKPSLKPDGMLQKPFAGRDLLDTISKVLGAAGGTENAPETPPPKFF